MDYIFNYTSGRKLVLYTEGNSILYFLFPFRRNSLPGTLQNDYLSDMTAIKHDDIIYFAYHNLDHRLILCTIDSMSDVVIMSDSSNLCNYRSIRLEGDHSNLYVFYVMTNPLTFNSELHYYSPYSDNEHILITDSSTANISYDVFTVNHKVILYCNNRFYSINPKNYENYYINNPDDIEVLKSENTKLQTTIIENNRIYGQQEARITELEHISDEKDHQIQKVKKESDIIVKNSQKMIEDIKLQYNELADYTKKLQDEYKSITDSYQY